MMLTVPIEAQGNDTGYFLHPFPQPCEAVAQQHPGWFQAL